MEAGWREWDGPFLVSELNPLKATKAKLVAASCEAAGSSGSWLPEPLLTDI